MSIRIPQEVHDWLRERAFTERRSINALVAEVLVAAHTLDLTSIGPVSETPETH